MAIIFHITSRDAWAGFDERLKGDPGFYSSEQFPIDGFIHCSTRDQVLRVADTRFRGRNDLVLLCIDTTAVGAAIRYENLEGGNEMFPHIYGELNTDAVVQVAEFRPGVEGYFELPALFAS
jgi:uncharacterized protein (DUF952 family)